MKKGLIVVVEGFDGSGKSTVCRKLNHILTKAGYDCVMVRQPGGTIYAEKVRGLLMDPDDKLSSKAQTYAFLSARQDLYDKVIAPAVSDGKIVICDRHYLSGLVFQPEQSDLILEHKVFEQDIFVHVTAEFETCIQRQELRLEEDSFSKVDLLVKKNQYDRYHELSKAIEFVAPYRETIRTDGPEKRTDVSIHSLAELIKLAYPTY